MRLAPLILLAACNQALGLDDGSLLPSDDPLPTCANDWRYRVPVTVENRTSTKVTGYAVRLVLDTASLAVAGKSPGDARGLRVTLADGVTRAPHYLERDPGTTATVFWIKVPVLHPGRTTLYLHYGPYQHLTTSSWAEVFGGEVIANPTFLSAGGWDVTEPAPEVSRFTVAWPRVITWSLQGIRALFVDLELDAYVPKPMVLAVSQRVVLPERSSYRLHFDLRVLAASRAERSVSLRWTSSTEPAHLWSLTSGVDNLTGAYFGEESRPLPPGPQVLAFVASLDHDAGGYVSAEMTNVGLRKVLDPEPEVTLGAEESACP